jgi:hypothetical protein
LSILTVTTLLGELTLPAASVTVWAVEDTAVPSVVRTWLAGQAPAGMPEPGSEQVKWTVTLEEYQPLAARVPALTAATIVGGVLSTLTVVDAVPVLPARSLQVAVSARDPSPLVVLEVVQAVASTPAPPAASDQFQVTAVSVEV